MINENMDYLQAGSPFPDWGYLCNDDAGEAGHWPPFIEAFVEYLHETYEPGTKEFDRLATFLFGVESHVEADILWHWGSATNTTSP